jgi:hypothetical protein
MPEPTFLATLFGNIARFWERSLVFFVAVTIGCFLLSGASLLFIFFGFKEVTTGWVVWFAFAGIGFGVLTIARSIEERRNPPFVLIANEQIALFILPAERMATPENIPSFRYISGQRITTTALCCWPRQP